MNVQIKKWGNSASVRIPASILQAAHLTVDDTVSMREEEGRIIIESVKKTITYRLEDLLAGITPENRHGLIDFGPPVGNEIW
jgi:antitoxin MazE